MTRKIIKWDSKTTKLAKAYTKRYEIEKKLISVIKAKNSKAFWRIIKSMEKAERQIERLKGN
jgi:hypothetical protein